MKPFANTTPPAGMCICHDCGYQWNRGQSGIHSCVERLQLVLEKALLGRDQELKAKLDLAVEALLPLAKINLSLTGKCETVTKADVLRAREFFYRLGVDLHVQSGLPCKHIYQEGSTVCTLCGT